MANENYYPQYSFTAWQASRPDRPLPADRIDDEFARISQYLRGRGGGVGGGGNGSFPGTGDPGGGDGGDGEYVSPVQMGPVLPTTGSEGDLFYNTTNGILYIFSGAQWVPLTEFLVPDIPASVAIVDLLPSQGDFTGQIVYLTTDSRLYLWTGDEWIAVVPAVTADAIQQGLFSNGLRPIETLNALPTIGNVEGRVVFLTTDKSLYIYLNGAFQTFQEAYSPDTPSGLEVFDADPTTGNFDGRVIFNRTLNKLRKYGDATWTDIAVNTAIGPNSITTEMLTANAVTAGKIAAAAIGTDQLQANAITAGKLAANSVTAVNIQAGAVVAASIATEAITAANIAAGAITSDKISTNAITAGKVSAGAIGAAQIAGGAITAEKLAANSVTAGKIAAATITAVNIQAQTITANNIQPNAISNAARASGSSQWPSVNTTATLTSMTFSCTPGASRIILFSTQLTDENSNGSVNASATMPIQGVYSITGGGSNIITADSSTPPQTTNLHTLVSIDTANRSGNVTFSVSGRGAPYKSGERTRVGFRSPTLAIIELKR